ncbi:MAG: RluA family pseudouridine synthase [Candidatus Omnitrophota bacterium]
MEEKRLVIAAQDAGTRVDVFLKRAESELSRTHIQDLLRQGLVLVNGKGIKAHYRLKANDELCWRVPPKEDSGLTAQDIPLDILFEDEDLLVLDKPSGLVVHPGAGNLTSTLAHALLFHTKDLSSVNPQRPGIVHRLDKDTSGVMVIAKNNASHFDLSKQFKEHSIERRYVALVSGHVQFDEGIVDVPIKRHVLDRKKMSVSFTEEAKTAHTFYRVLKRYTDFTALELIPKTGRTHQLRVHLSYLGHPVLGDATYGTKKNFPRLALHALELGFQHPSTKKFVKFSSPLPPEMKAATPGLHL